jgi:hypothetical protein
MGAIETFDPEDNIPFGDQLKTVVHSKTFDASNPFSGIKKLDLEMMFKTEPDPLDFVLPGLVRGTVGLMVSPGGAGKSMFLLQGALHIATGRDTLGLGQVATGRVVIFSGEDTAEALHHRLYAMYRQFNFTDKEICDAKRNLEIIPTVGTSIDIHNTHVMNAMRDITRDARLVGLDTLTRYHTLDENKAEDAKRIMATLEELAYKQNQSVIFAHHVSKAAVSSGMQELQQAARGSSVFVDNARWASFVASMTKQEAEKLKIEEEDRLKYVKWNVCKQNYSAPIKDIWLERKKGGVLIPTDFLNDEQKEYLYKQASQSTGGNSNGWKSNKR